MRLVARLISFFFHPIVMPLYAMLVMLFVTPLGFVLTNRAICFLLFMTFLFTGLFPLTFVLFLRRLGVVSSFAMHQRKERITPLLFCAFMCYLTCVFLTSIPRLHSLFAQMFFALTIFLLILSFVTKFWKISLHMAAIGGLFAIIFIFSYHSWLLAVVVFSTGLLGTVRLWLQAHDSLQVYGGVSLGFCYFLVYFSFIIV